MARSRSSRPAPRAAPSRNTPTTHQAPPAPAQYQQQRQPGLFAQMASTAAGVAAGSAVGHTIGAGLSSVLGFGGGHAPAPVAEQAPVQQQANNQAYQACANDQKALLRCLESNSSDISACQFYLDMLKQCQAAQNNTYA